jgi:hypothetical protein
MVRATRITAVVIIPVLLAAFVILFGFPDRTPELWAWTIRPDMTAVTIGAGYLGGAWFFFRVARNRDPGRVVGGLVAASAFTALLGLATFVHWDRFNHDHVSFWAWLGLYVVSPVLLPFLAVGNRRQAGPVGGERLPGWARGALAVVGATQLVAAACWTVAPTLAMDVWPWELTALTARTLAAFVAFTGLFLLWPLVDPRRQAVQIGLEAVTVGLVATAIGSLRGRDDFTGPTAATIAYAASLASVLVLLMAVQWPRQRPARAAART